MRPRRRMSPPGGTPSATEVSGCSEYRNLGGANPLEHCRPATAPPPVSAALVRSAMPSRASVARSLRAANSHASTKLPLATCTTHPHVEFPSTPMGEFSAAAGGGVCWAGGGVKPFRTVPNKSDISDGLTGLRRVFQRSVMDTLEDKSREPLIARLADGAGLPSSISRTRNSIC